MNVRHPLRVGMWLSAILLSLSLLVSPAYAEAVNLSGTILQDSNLRSGPGTTHGVIGAGRPGQAVTITERTDVGDWYQLSTGEWIAAFLVEVQATTAITETAPIVEAPAAPPAPVVSIGTGSANRAANLRGGPGTNFPVVGGTQTGQGLTIVAKNDAGDWYQLDNGQWIAAFLVANLAGDIAAPAQPVPVQVEAEVQPTPAPTIQPTVQPAAPVSNPNSGQRRGAICRDGWQSTATGRGACSHHGGVDHWLYYP